MIDVEYYNLEIGMDVGDLVEFECGDLDNSGPRWQFNDDLGPSDIWAKGRVTYVDDQIIQVEYTVPGSSEISKCTWPNHGHDDYDALQWTQEGYLRWSGDVEAPVCECGAEKANTTHVDWCPKYK